MREVRYQSIADDLRRRLLSGEFAAGRVLPSEADLGAAYDASRVTVRRALEILRGEGLVESRRGAGWNVAADPLRQSLGHLGTIEAQLADLGVDTERRVLEFGFTRASRQVRAVLGAEEVLRVRRLNLADGVPFARVTVWVSAELGADLSRADVERSTFYELLPVELGGATQTIGAAAATADDAAVLGIPVGTAVLRCTRITHDVDGRPVLYSEHVFPSERTEFVVDLPSSSRSMAPTGLRLVEGVRSHAR
jgi:GntR family transcriptional regulator